MNQMLDEVQVKKQKLIIVDLKIYIYTFVHCTQFYLVYLSYPNKRLIQGFNIQNQMGVRVVCFYHKQIVKASKLCEKCEFKKKA